MCIFYVSAAVNGNAEQAAMVSGLAGANNHSL
jgi:hypothetical protein